MHRTVYRTVHRSAIRARAGSLRVQPFSVARLALKDRPAGSGDANDDEASRPDHSDAAKHDLPEDQLDQAAKSAKDVKNKDISSSEVPEKPEEAQDNAEMPAEPKSKTGKVHGKPENNDKTDEVEAQAKTDDKADKPSASSKAEKAKSDKPKLDKKRQDRSELENALRDTVAAQHGTPRLARDEVFCNPASGARPPNTGSPNGEGADDGAADANSAPMSPVSKNERLLPIQLQYRPVFPGMASHLQSSDPKLISAVAKLQETNRWDHRVVAVMSRKKAGSTMLLTNLDDAYEVGTVCRLRTTLMTHHLDGSTTLFGTLFPLYRVRTGELVETVRGGASIPASSAPEPSAGQKSTPEKTSSPRDDINVQWMKGITALPNEPYAYNEEELQQLCRKVIDLLNQMAAMSSPIKHEVEKFSQLVPMAPGASFRQPDFLADFGASLIQKNEGLQEILEITNVKQRLRQVADLLEKEILYMRVQEGIFKYGHDQSQQRNREIILHEYLRYIKRELNMDTDDKSKLADKFQERAAGLEMPEEARRVFDEEINKFRNLEPNAGEYSTVRAYLEWLTQLPWGKYSPDKFVIRKAKEVLDNSHYGLQDVKDRILEFLAVGKLSGSVDGKIICLAGPPGVGKTSIAKAIAEALGRKFDRFSVGGLFDVSEIKGHRRTYVASLPGRVVQALKKTQTLNPVILIDEIDKLGRGGSHGDPSAALLEVLDPEQNKNFQDTYLEVPLDLSRVLFVCTANNLENIPAPLMDRMEVINIPGYLPDEKVEIAHSYLAPKASKESGLGEAGINISRAALQRLVENYTRESGVRGLNKTLEKIYRKLAFQFVRDIEDKTPPEAEVEQVVDSADAAAVKEPAEDEIKIVSGQSISESQVSKDIVRDFKLEIGPNELSKYIGIAPHSSNRLFDQIPAGVAMGLAWTPTGGVPLFIESVLQEGLSPKSTPRFTRTGQLGEVMNESTSIAYSFSRMFMTTRFPRNKFLDFAVVHTHFPEGAIKKDGPSAGIAMATSLISLAMNTPASNDVAMTGELTLTGKVLQIGGLREKAVAAKTLGAKVIIFPEDNRAEWEDLPEKVRDGLEARPVRNFSEVFDVVFGVVDPAQVNAAWPQLADVDKEKSKKSVPASASS